MLQSKTLILYVFFCSILIAQTQEVVDRSSASIKRAIKNSGGNNKTEKSIENSLNWFKSIQNPDGSWGDTSKSSLTSLVLLSYMGYGHKPGTGPYGKTLLRAMIYLMDTETTHKIDRGYALPIKTIAISEAYGLTGDNAVKNIIENYVKVLSAGQQKNGAFDYYLDSKSNRQDMSLSSWVFQAFKSAQEVGCSVKELDSNIDKSCEFLLFHTTGKNKFFYSTRDNVPKDRTTMSMQSAGSFLLQMFKGNKIKELQDDLKDIGESEIKNLDWNSPPKNCLYGWYYATNSMHIAGGSKWKDWYKKVQHLYIDNQNPEGYWTHPGSFYGNTKSEKDQKIFATTFCCLTLLAPGRYPKERNKSNFKVPNIKK